MLASLHASFDNLRSATKTARGPGVPFFKRRLQYGKGWHSPIPMNFTNFSPQWPSRNWVSYLEDDPALRRPTFAFELPGAGAETHNELRLRHRNLREKTVAPKPCFAASARTATRRVQPDGSRNDLRRCHRHQRPEPQSVSLPPFIRPARQKLSFAPTPRHDTARLRTPPPLRRRCHRAGKSLITTTSPVTPSLSPQLNPFAPPPPRVQGHADISRRAPPLEAITDVNRHSKSSFEYNAQRSY